MIYLRPVCNYMYVTDYSFECFWNLPITIIQFAIYVLGKKGYTLILYQHNIQMCKRPVSKFLKKDF